eukprot:CAMPEP_0195521900 /NCGR_PEP_ID=MMETSP0794_2-20130614/19623_1 /TAXON_ID=515487 /ORGANISM="Stephanopyxis turris, Strain CCMP 815" /LENGTH=167 /DNA_ID=CAMNT_0040651543 /DNA_START=59 /DNA_END=562 /DNA_ORIENTATION=+
MTITEVLVIHGGELAKDVAARIESQKPSNSSIVVTLQSASVRPKKLIDNPSSTKLHCFILQTIENSAPTEEGGTTTRFFKRKTHPTDLLSKDENSFLYTVLGLGDSNLLLDRQTTTAEDCNQVAQELDGRLEALGGKRFYDLAVSDERTGLKEVEPWINGLWESVIQ